MFLFLFLKILASDIRHTFKGLFKFEEKNYLLTIERIINLERQEMRAVSKNGHLLELTKINSKERHYVQFPHP